MTKCCLGKIELEGDSEIFRNALERRGMKMSRSKTEYSKAGGADDGKELMLQGEKLKRAKNFKYLGSTVTGGAMKDVKKK